MQVAAIGLIAVDTGGIHWAIGNIIYQSFQYVLVSGVIMRFITSPYVIELTRPWKSITLTVGIGFLIWGSFYYSTPDWDIPTSLIMGFFAYLTASWSMHVMVERNWKRFPLMIFATWWTVDVGRVYQQTFVDTYSKVAFAKLYTTKTPITAARSTQRQSATVLCRT